MRFIRTDGNEIIAYDETLDILNKPFILTQPSHIVKEADNIKELCDEFILTHYFKETNYTNCEVLKTDKNLMIEAVRLKKKENKDKEFNIYGAIWIIGREGQPTLKPVVRMNDEGELELLREH